MTSAVVAPQLPSFDFTGLPQILWSGKYAIETANVRFTFGQEAPGRPTVRVDTIMTVKTQDKPFTGRILVPRRRWGDTQSGNPGWKVALTVDKASVALRPISERGTVNVRPSGVSEYSSDLAFDQQFQPRRTYVLRTQVTLPVGKTGYEGKERITGMWVGGEVPLDQFQISFAYTQNDIFGLPTVAMGGASVEIGNSGSFIRLSNFAPPGDMITFRYFPPGLN